MNDPIDVEAVCCDPCRERLRAARELVAEAERTGFLPTCREIAEVWGCTETWAITVRRRVFGMNSRPVGGGGPTRRRIPYPVPERFRKETPWHRPRSTS